MHTNIYLNEESDDDKIKVSLLLAGDVNVYGLDTLKHQYLERQGKWWVQLAEYRRASSERR